MHPLVTLLGTLVGLRLLGPIGLLVGPSLLQCSMTLVRLYDREYGSAS
jgi:predicted PurR-regulated permease PerM